MGNVFENACFGKAYLTRDGRKALYQKDDKLGGLYHHWLITEKDHFACTNDGEQNIKTGQSPLDVVSEWREAIDAECAYSGISPGDDDKLASESFFKGVKVVHLEGFLIGDVTETESGFSVEFVKEGMR